jgi:hypothetical protein
MPRTTTTKPKTTKPRTKAATTKSAAKSRSAPQTRRSTEVPAKPSAARRVLKQARSPKVYLPVLAAVGVGAALINRMLDTLPKSGLTARATAALSPTVRNAFRALAALGRQAKARIT